MKSTNIPLLIQTHAHRSVIVWATPGRSSEIRHQTQLTAKAWEKYVQELGKPKSIYYLEYGRHVARLRRRHHRAHAPTSNTASHATYEQEPITRSVQLPYFRATAFSQVELFIDMLFPLKLLFLVTSVSKSE